ncbi:MAG: hypothetical protein H6812_10645 [Phycisphaeraceae bacterium]|nr:hypothetical protein [Phycisphaerales bacterium]MCB9843704.1 hypothetical protein [Phycisphaeraceae bacterium]
MSDKLWEKLTRRDDSPEQMVIEQASDEAEDLGMFGWLRGVRDRAMMLELRKKDGHCMAIGYGWIERVEFQPEHGITLHLHGNTIRIKGSGLNTEVRPTIRLFDGILRQRVPWLRESDRADRLSERSRGVCVESIEWEE